MLEHNPGPVLFENRVLRGRRLQSLLLTGLSESALAHTLTGLIAPHGEVTPAGLLCMPRGTVLPQEARLSRAEGLLPDDVVRELERWWPGSACGPGGPRWDLACAATVAGHPGLVLVQAHGHAHELGVAGHPSRCPPHGCPTCAAIGEARAGLERVVPGWHLRGALHYPLAERFAWSWKLASLGVPVILVYLGFLDVADTSDRGAPFRTGQEWHRALRTYAQGIVPDAAWNAALEIDGTPLFPLIRALRLTWHLEPTP